MSVPNVIPITNSNNVNLIRNLRVLCKILAPLQIQPQVQIGSLVLCNTGIWDLVALCRGGCLSCAPWMFNSFHPSCDNQKCVWTLPLAAKSPLIENDCFVVSVSCYNPNLPFIPLMFKEIGWWWVPGGGSLRSLFIINRDWAAPLPARAQWSCLKATSPVTHSSTHFWGRRHPGKFLFYNHR